MKTIDIDSTLKTLKLRIEQEWQVRARIAASKERPSWKKHQIAYSHAREGALMEACQIIVRAARDQKTAA